MSRIEAREAPAVRTGIGREEVDIAGAAAGRLRPDVERFAVRVGNPSLKTLDHPALPLDLAGVVRGIGEVGDDEVREVARVGTPFVGSRNADTDFVRRDGNRIGAGRVGRQVEAGLARAGAEPILGYDPGRIASRRPWLDRQIVESILQQILAKRADITEPETGLGEDLPLEREVPLPRLRHLQIRIGGRQTDPSRGRFSGDEDNAICCERIGQIERHDVIAGGVRGVVSNARSDLGEDGLEDTAVECAIASADRKFSALAGERSPEPIAVPVRRIGKAQARIDVVAVLEAVVDQMIFLPRNPDPLVARAEVERQVVANAPVVLAVPVVFLQLVLQVGRSKTFLEGADASIHEHGVTVRIGHALARQVRRPECPETAVAILGVIVQRRATNVRSQLERMTGPASRGDVVDELLIALKAIDGKGAGVAENRAVGDRGSETYDRRIVAGVDVPLGGSQTEPVTTLLHGVRGKDSGPRQSEVRLVKVLDALFADDQLTVGKKLLLALLISSDHAV